MGNPGVVAHRVVRMALAGPSPSARDRREFHLMGAEKLAAFQESWLNMSFATLRTNQQLALSALHSFWFPWLAERNRGSSASLWQQAAHGLLCQGLAPLHRRAVANAKRLSRTTVRR